MDDLRIENYLEVGKMGAMEQAKVVDSHDEKAKYGRMSATQGARKKNDSTSGEEVPVEKLVEIANHYVDRFTTKLSFSYDPKLDIPMILVKEKDTGKIIRQIPPEQMVSLMKKMEEIAGIIYNRRA